MSARRQPVTISHASAMRARAILKAWRKAIYESNVNAEDGTLDASTQRDIDEFDASINALTVGIQRSRQKALA